MGKHQRGINDKIMDIEDLVSYGQKEIVCPFYISKDTQDTADIIFLPYNYLTDKIARKAQGINVNNAIIIFDEAHNVERYMVLI